jgi:hypothetical protein
VKRYLAERDVRYTLKNLATDPDAVAEFVARGFLLPPVLVIDGVAIPGFQPDRIDRALDDSATST